MASATSASASTQLLLTSKTIHGRELVLAPAQLVRGPEQELAALGGRHAPPALEGPGRHAHGLVGLLAAALGDQPQHLVLLRGVDRREGLVARHPLAVDQQVVALPEARAHRLERGLHGGPVLGSREIGVGLVAELSSRAHAALLGVAGPAGEPRPRTRAGRRNEDFPMLSPPAARRQARPGLPTADFHARVRRLACSCRSGGIGRRARFRAVFASASVGSSPTSGTNPRPVPDLR